jgi:hypothetical protein
MNDWVEPVRMAAGDCANRCLPKVSAKSLVGALSFALGRGLHWKRWTKMPDIVLSSFSRPDCLDELVSQLQMTNNISASVLRSVLRFGLIDSHLEKLSKLAMRPENRALVLKALIDGEVTWASGYEYKWVDKVYGIKRLVPVIARRPLNLNASKDFFVGQGATDRNILVRRIAAQGLIEHAAKLENVNSLTSLFVEEKSLSIRERIDFLNRTFLNTTQKNEIV